ncbi:MAG: Cys-tRNA(Pro)/Cys-tRNA(Cys) deacylase [Frankiales bacterium]|jgi:Cys-tRNA(Pro)/Cys-tRNA(Cys) deacylase|nr:Cys-tRNA(Pro)/Cys-tRNA(Cys) deacylase [Frankiales bacterium]
MAKKAAVGTPATVALTRAGIPFTLHSFDLTPSTASYGLAAAEALGVLPERVFKTLLAEVDGRLVVAVVPVSGQLDLKALAAAAGGKKAAMAEPALAERTTGYVVGGISPLGQRKQLATFVDASAAAHPTIYVSAGRRGADIELAPQDLIVLLGATIATLGR